MASLLYLLTGIATAIPVIVMLGWAVWGAPISATEYLSLMGSLILVVASVAGIKNTRRAARIAVVGAIAIWSLYLPTIVGMVQVRLNDQELDLLVLKRVGSSLPLTIGQLLNGPLPASELQLLDSAGVTGLLEEAGASRTGSGPRARAILVVQDPLTEAVRLLQPDATTIVYVQDGLNWTRFPKDAPTLSRFIEISPLAGVPPQNMILVQLANGASQGFGLSWLEPGIGGK